MGAHHVPSSSGTVGAAVEFTVVQKTRPRSAANQFTWLYLTQVEFIGTCTEWPGADYA
jgi:hypothetical protein